MRGLGTLFFVVGLLLLAGLSILIVTGDEALLGQIGLGVWSMCFLLAAIFSKLAEVASKMTVTRSNTHEDSS